MYSIKTLHLGTSYFFSFSQVRVADDRDFERLKNLCDCHDGWNLAYDQPPTRVYTRPAKNSTFHMIKVSL